VSLEAAGAQSAALAASDIPDALKVRDQLAKAFYMLTPRHLDPENAVKDAVGALEGAARLRLNKPRGDVGDLQKDLKAIMHPALAGSVDALLKIEGFRGDAAAHAAKEPVSPADALLVVHQCSAAIAWLLSPAAGTA
jgi:hypothetical protein